MRIIFAVLLLASFAAAQDAVLTKGATEFGAYTGGGVSIPGGIPGSHDYWMVAGRWSRVMAESGGGASSTAWKCIRRWW